jgi:hypothetical protein
MGGHGSASADEVSSQGLSMQNPTNTAMGLAKLGNIGEYDC